MSEFSVGIPTIRTDRLEYQKIRRLFKGNSIDLLLVGKPKEILLESHRTGATLRFHHHQTSYSVRTGAQTWAYRAEQLDRSSLWLRILVPSENKN